MKISWDERWRQKKNEALPAPDPWLLEHKSLFSGGTALDLACGRGRNSLLLAESGYRVFGVDSSPAALELLKISATLKNLSIETLEHNLDFGLPEHPHHVDLLLCVYFLQRNLFAAIRTRIAPGGLFIGRSFCQKEPAAEPSDIIYAPGELAELFRDWDILDYEEGGEVSERGGTLAGIVARKPAES